MTVCPSVRPAESGRGPIMDGFLRRRLHAVHPTDALTPFLLCPPL